MAEKSTPPAPATRRTAGPASFLPTTAARRSASAPAGAAVSASMAPLLAAGAPTFEFAKEPNSPFKDGYSIAGERAALADYIAFVDETNPPNLSDRYIELLDREERLERMQRDFQETLGADRLVGRSEAIGMRNLGRLVDEEEDQMELHTLEAYRMFAGRRREPGTEARPIIGGRRIASVLRNLWLLTSQDNPYADWALVRHEHEMAGIQQRLDREIEGAQAAIAEQAKKGIRLSMLRNAEPAVLTLGFKSPYGFAVATLITRFDYFVRLMKTLERKDLRTDEQVRQAIYTLTRLIRAAWYGTERFERWLSNEQMRSMSRVDFVKEGDAAAAGRVEFATQVFGHVPSQIYTCAIQPKHSRRQRQITPEERALLTRVGEKLAQAEAVADAQGQGNEDAAAPVSAEGLSQVDAAGAGSSAGATAEGPDAEAVHAAKP